jgi:hypothetical protein
VAPPEILDHLIIGVHSPEMHDLIPPGEADIDILKHRFGSN